MAVKGLHCSQSYFSLPPLTVSLGLPSAAIAAAASQLNMPGTEWTVWTAQLDCHVVAYGLQKFLYHFPP